MTMTFQAGDNVQVLGTPGNRMGTLPQVPGWTHANPADIEEGSAVAACYSFEKFRGFLVLSTCLWRIDTEVRFTSNRTAKVRLASLSKRTQWQ
jgi:hypothetical protein